MGVVRAHGGVHPAHNGGHARSLWSCPDHEGIGTPQGLRTAREESLPHNGGCTRVPPVLPEPRRDMDTLWEFGHAERSTTHTAAGTLGSLRSRRGRRGVGTPLGGLGTLGEGLPPHSGDRTRAPPSPA